LPRPNAWESRAVRIATVLSWRLGQDALGCALGRRSAAEAAGDHINADLYRGVSTVLADRGGVFGRSRARASPT
jgi:hypothetical protein